MEATHCRSNVYEKLYFNEPNLIFTATNDSVQRGFNRNSDIAPLRLNPDYYQLAFYSFSSPTIIRLIFVLSLKSEIVNVFFSPIKHQSLRLGIFLYTIHCLNLLAPCLNPCLNDSMSGFLKSSSLFISFNSSKCSSITIL